MLGEAFTCLPLPRHARGGGANLVLGLEVDSLGLEVAMIDPCIDIEFGELQDRRTRVSASAILSITSSTLVPHRHAISS